VVDVEQWAELRRAFFVERKSIKALVRETGLSRNTIRQALRSDADAAHRNSPPSLNELPHPVSPRMAL
jgi:hypothetical protein